jgi:hypothetical protein
VSVTIHSYSKQCTKRDFSVTAARATLVKLTTINRCKPLCFIHWRVTHCPQVRLRQELSQQKAAADAKHQLELSEKQRLLAEEEAKLVQWKAEQVE